MPTHFCLTVRFLQPYSHGRSGDGDPEWPPSPLRVFQALVAAAAARWNERIRLEYAAPALRWLERQPEPTIVAAPGVQSDVTYRLYVPDNVADKVAKSWSGGREASIADYRTEKDVRPTHLLGEAVHYLFSIAESDSEFETHRNTLIDAAHSITHLGWGIDMVVGYGTVLSDDDAAKLSGEHWRPSAERSFNNLRVPTKGTLDDLATKHTAFLNRLPGEGFKPVPPLSMFRIVAYCRPIDTVSRPFAAFAILKPDASGNRSFDTLRQSRDLAAWVRNTTGHVCQDWPDIAAFVHGHDPAYNRLPLKGERADDRFMYLPLPTINHKLNRVESIRRVLVAAPPRFTDRVEWVRRRLPGQDLTDQRSRVVVGILNLLPTSDWVLRQYTDPARVWSTVTPLVLPGHDEAAPVIIARRVRLAPDQAARQRVREKAVERTERLLRLAFEQAGWPRELVAEAKLEWQSVGFRAGVERVDRYCVPEPLNQLPRYHVRVRWPVPVRGPLAVGAGRYRGLGVFAAE